MLDSDFKEAVDQPVVVNPKDAIIVPLVLLPEEAPTQDVPEADAPPHADGCGDTWIRALMGCVLLIMVVGTIVFFCWHFI
jgi:hypothetical protein